ncbi:MAG TPA: Do family serine endopeptidase, partial [Pyrinomonadaceae bacterium]|nr:Do family serine endopeptidase [Pyrinomonadaceae bacterium]
MNHINSFMSDAQWIRRVKSALILVLTIFLLGACKDRDAATKALPPPPANATASGNTPAISQISYADLVDRVAPAVVTVRSERRVRTPQQFPFFDDPFFRDFFGDRLPRGQQEAPERRERGLGSGVIVSQDGYILTNHHVIDGAEEIRIELTDNRTFSAKVVGSDPPSDLAVLKIDASNLPLLSLGDSDRVRVGDVVLALGNPLGVGQTVTSGIISAKGRSTGLSDGSFEDFLQTDAPINRGNSGGALVNTNGELIGINSQILSPSGGNIGIGFAIPSNMARNVMDQLIKSGKVRRGQLGVTIQPVSSEIAQSLGLQEARGVIVNSVQPGSAAERAGIRQGDIITAFNGAPVNDSNSLRNRVASTQPGTEVTLTVSRDGREQQLRATLGELAVSAEGRGTQDGGGRGASGGRLGINVEPLTPDLAR